MKKLILSISFLTLYASLSQAQDIYQTVLQKIEQNNTTLTATRLATDAEIIGAKTGLTLPDPEVGLAYSWSNPKEIGAKKNASVTQSFDFPTVYANRGKLANLRQRTAEEQYLTVRQSILLEAKQTCIQLIFNNALEQLYGEQLSNMKSIAEATSEMYKQGTTTSLEYNKTILNYSIIENDVRRVKIEQRKLNSVMATLNGGCPIKVDETQYPSISMPSDFATWLDEASERSPELRRLNSELDAANRELKLTKSECLPKLSVGYTGEYVHGSNFSGVTFGFSVPLWENRNRVKESKAKIIATQAEITDAQLNLRDKLTSLFNEVVELRQIVNQIDKALNASNNQELALKAYESGKMSSIEYFHELEYYYQASEKRLVALRDLQLAYAELQAHTL